MLGSLFFLAGESFPELSHIEDGLRSRLSPAFSQWVGQQEILDRTGERRFSTALARRVAALERLLADAEEPEHVFLLGRSTGARVATLAAMRRPVAGVICLGYPFREARHVIEPDRFAHLARIAVPTLIIQGRADKFGGEDLTEHYALSPHVAVRFVNGGHDLRITQDAWDAIAEMILTFCDRTNSALPMESEPFDEAFYLRTYPDIAAAVAAGKLQSGEQHFLKHGRRERRRFRLVSGGA
jgi:pimeloyl-ACP methyl ester carboxylesterase